MSLVQLAQRFDHQRTGAGAHRAALERFDGKAKLGSPRAPHWRIFTDFWGLYRTMAERRRTTSLPLESMCELIFTSLLAAFETQSRAVTPRSRIRVAGRAAAAAAAR